MRRAEIRAGQLEQGLRHLRQETANSQDQGVYHPGHENCLCVSADTRTPQSNDYALARNQKGVESFFETLSLTIAVGRAYAKRVGLAVDWDDPSATISKLAWITQCPREFDFESPHWPSQVVTVRKP